jgi:hypothetical protein
MLASSFVGQLPYSFSGVSYFEWVLDYGVSHHMSLNSSSFAYMSHLPFILIMTIDDTPTPLASVGFGITSHLFLLNVYLILKLTLNLASDGQLCDYNDYLVIFSFLFLCIVSAVSKAD